MIHLVSFVKAKPGMSREDFRTHWRDVHGPLVTEVAKAHSTFYGQYPRLDADYDRPGAPDYDGVAVQSFESEEDFRAFLAEPDVAAKLGPDGPKFMDAAASPWIMTSEPLVFLGQQPG